MTIRIAGVLLVLLHGSSQEDGLLGRWRLEASRQKDGVFKPVAGAPDAVVSGPAEFAAESPRTLLFGLAPAGDKPRSQGASPAPQGSTYLSLAREALPVKAMSVEAVVRVEKPAKWGGLIGFIQDNGDYEKGWLLGYNETQFTFAMAGAAGNKRLTYLAAKRAYQPGAWYHVVGTYDGAEQRIYVDGTLENTDKTQRGEIAYPPKGFYTIGAYRDDDELHPMTGQMEELSVWGRTLTAEEVRKRFEARKADLPEIVPVRPQVVDWPCYLRDPQRTGLTEAAVTLPLRLQWAHAASLPPSPAWPPEAKQDFWNNKPVLKQRVTFDRAFQVVSVGDLVCYGSSADDRVVGLDAATGRPRWAFQTDGPVRLAPTISDGRVLFGSDDGCVYCLSGADGALQWKLRVGPADRRIVGNGRVISAWPVRTDVLVEDGVAHACAGLFPGEGVVHAAIDVKTGKKLGEAPADVSPQGYMEQRAGRLFVSTGRDPAGAFVTTLKRKGKAYGAEVSAIPGEYPYAFIGVGDLRFGGGDGKVAGFSAADGRELWSAKVEGKAYSLAFSQGRLLVSTDRGLVYAFTAGAGEAAAVPAAPSPPEPTRGYALVLGGAASPKTAGMRLVQAPKPSGALPYADCLFNLVVGDGPAEELLRVLRPGGEWISGESVTRREPLPGVGEWSHMYADPANTACSDDRTVGGELRLQWFGLPGPEGLIDRHHRTVPPLAAGGRLFVPGNDRVYALDAYNGSILWEAQVPESRRMAAYRDCGNMIAADDALYMASAGACVQLEGATGKSVRRMEAPRGEWGYLAAVDDLLLGSTVAPGASRREHSRRIVATETYWDFVPSVCSDSLFALERPSGAPRWTHAPKGSILNSTITVGGGRIYFVEGGISAREGRAKLGELLPRADVVALDLKSGKELWRKAHDLAAIQHVIYAAYAQEKLVVAGSRNEGKSVWYDLHGIDAAEGRPLWKATQDQKVPVNGEHGEQDHHPVLVGDRVYVEPCVYDLASGRRIEDWGWKPRRGCGTISASASTLFYRDNTATMFDLGAKKAVKVTTVSRPGCFINMLPAGGMLLIPEASSGCSCDYAIQASMGFMPVRRR